MISFGKNTRIELLKSYQRISNSGGRISLFKILLMRKSLYIGLGILFIAGFAAIAININIPIPGTAISGVAAGSFITDVCIMITIRRALPIMAKIIDSDSIDKLLEESANKKSKNSIKK